MDAEKLLVRNKASPYVGETLYGRVHQTYLAGKKVWDFKDQKFGASTGALLISGGRVTPETSQ